MIDPAIRIFPKTFSSMLVTFCAMIYDKLDSFQFHFLLSYDQEWRQKIIIFLFFTNFFFFCFAKVQLFV